MFFLPMTSLGACFALHPSMAPTAHTVGITLPAKENHLGTVIFLHGYDETAEDCLPVVHELQKETPWLKYVIPQAQMWGITGTIKPGFEAERHHAWFDILARVDTLRGTHDPQWDDATGIRQTRYWLQQLLLKEAKQTKNLILMGFDQGGAQALFTGLTTDIPEVKGLIGISCWLPLRPYLERDGLQNPIPVLVQYGRYDEVVPVQVGWDTRKTLAELGTASLEAAGEKGPKWKDVKYQEYGASHSVIPAMLKDQIQFLHQVIPSLPQPIASKDSLADASKSQDPLKTDADSAEAVFCTQDVKTCPDGSYVVRDPKNQCKFSTCLQHLEL
eukprot:gb/GEZN01011697.1/.p1 GENE.gb/GEZN01011697.1/~~gb/GEZN01011697.1/.p1  ORF type:complete len:330 (+),score=30.81 gb/GEZN01011697.1/:48-1037(+)